jgi:hypothetical protein
MSLLVAFAVGYVVGARGGNEGLDEVIASLKAIRDSDEVKDLALAVRSHVTYTLRELATRLEDGPGGDDGEADEEGDLLAQVRNLTRRG